MNAGKGIITAIHVTKLGPDRFRPWIEFQDGTDTYASGPTFPEPWAAHQHLNDELRRIRSGWADGRAKNKGE